jgi:hypothetical protein
MRAAVMSTGWLGTAGERSVPTMDRSEPATTRLRSISPWNPETFAREQIRRLVRQVFLASAPQAIRQVVFSAVEPEADIGTICLRVGETLAIETPADVAVVAASPACASGFNPCLHDSRNDPGDKGTALRRMATRLKGNLWLVPDEIARANSTSLRTFLSDVRREFPYSILQGQAACESSVTAEIAQAADGLILVLSAQRTRRAAALKTKQMLEQAEVHILGTVLSDREFPIPERIYRRL